MSEETAVAEPTVEKPAKRRGRPPKKYTLSAEELEALVSRKVQEVVGDKSYQHAPADDEIEAEVTRRLNERMGQVAAPANHAIQTEPPRRGLEWPPFQPAPAGFQKIKQNDGTFVLENLPPLGFNPNERADVLRRVTTEYEVYKIPTDQHPTPSDPEVLYVNKAWRKLFKNVTHWGDTCSIQVDESKFEDNTGPQFLFVRIAE